MEKRNLKLDNFKAILIFLVVLGHLFAMNLNNGLVRFLYILIYLFHMPCFIFISGYLSEFNLKKSLKNILWPYFIFQIYYFIYYKYLLLEEVEFSFYKPIYILWYLFVLFFMRLTIPLLNKIKQKGIFQQFLFLLITIVCSLLAGYIPFELLEFSLIRFLFFYPFFIAGFLFKFNEDFFNNSLLKFINFILILVIIFIYILNTNVINTTWLQEAFPYYKDNCHWSFSLFHLISGFVFILFFYNLISSRNIRGFTFIGRNTLQIFLLHGFFVKMINLCFSDLLKNLNFFEFFVVCIVFCIFIVYFLSLNLFKKYFGFLFKFPL